MNLRILKAGLAGTALLGMAATAQAATTTGTAKGRILKQITLTATQDLDFGTIVSGAAADTVVISTGGSRTCGAGLVCSGTTTAAAFNATGSSGATVNITAAASVTLSEVGGATMNASLVKSANTMVLTGVSNIFNVGGTLTVGANQVDGVYTGSFNVSVDYQ